MACEIERKFLVSGDYKSFAIASKRIVQGYLSDSPERTVRVRVIGERGFLTIKGITGDLGIIRDEWEYEIPTVEAEELLKICLPGVIDKTRYYVPFEGVTFEVDEFYGQNEGLTIAEVELNSPEQMVLLPQWIGCEVTGIEKYYNSMLVKNPYSKW
jgi:adenylate cyclase